MKIRIITLGKTLKRELRVSYGKGLKILWIGLYFIGIQISFGKNPVDLHKKMMEAKKVTESQSKYLRGRCIVCQRPLYGATLQMIKYHGECRREGRARERVMAQTNVKTN